MKSKTTLFLAVILSFTFIMLGCTQEDKVSEPSSIQIGVLLPLTGELDDRAAEIQTFLDIALTDANQQLELEDSDIRLTLQVIDTETNPTTARTQMEVMSQSGIKCFIGPITSAEMLEASQSTLINDCLLLSPSSTSTDLSIAGDHLYRFVAGDAQMAEALAHVIWDQGVRYIASMFREDSWGFSLSNLVQIEFENIGGSQVMKTEYLSLRQSSARSELIIVANSIEALNVPSEQIAIQINSFNEAIMLFEVASELLIDYPILGEVQWFGSDGFVQSPLLFDYPQAAAFAHRVEFIAPIMGIPGSEALETLLEQYQGSAPWSYSIISYDLVQIIAELMGSASDINDVASLETALNNVTNEYTGLSGSISLDENGDRTEGLYHFWQVVESGSTYAWEHILSYNEGHFSTP